MCHRKLTILNLPFRGINVVPFLEYVGFPEKLVKLLEHSQSGYALTAYAMYKVRMLISLHVGLWQFL